MKDYKKEVKELEQQGYIRKYKISDKILFYLGFKSVIKTIWVKNR